MTLEEFGENVANCGVLSDTEARYLFTLYSKTKPSMVLPFKDKRRMGSFELLEFEAYRINNRILGSDMTGVTLDFKNVIANFEISEIQFCQPPGIEAIDGVFIEQTGATSIFKLQNKTYLSYPVYAASFEPPFQFTAGVELKVQFETKPGNKNSVAELRARTQNHSFNMKGRETTISFQGTGLGSNKWWYCLTALKLGCAKLIPYFPSFCHPKT